VQAGQEAIRAIAYEVAIGSERIGVSPTVTVPGKEIFNRIRRSTEFNNVLTCELVFRSDRRQFTLTRDGNGTRTALQTDPTYGGPAAVAAVLHPEHVLGNDNSFRAIHYGLTGQPSQSSATPYREPWQERWFQTRPQLRGPSPLYPANRDPSDIGTLPAYSSQASRGSMVLELSRSRTEAIVAEINHETANELRSMVDELSADARADEAHTQSPPADIL
jgi:hypothetical protein